jgi:hypothetical protein
MIPYTAMLTNLQDLISIFKFDFPGQVAVDKLSLDGFWQTQRVGLPVRFLHWRPLIIAPQNLG